MSKIDAIMMDVKCGKCGERIKVRINPSIDINDYILKKEILGNNCQNLMYAELHFDNNYNVISSNITNGKLISVEK